MVTGRDCGCDYDVVIAGGSFAGLALARSLSVCVPGQLRLLIIDKANISRSKSGVGDGRAFALSASSVRLLDAIGVWDLVASDAQAITDVDITDDKVGAPDRPVLVYFDNREESGDPASYILESGVLKRALLQLVCDDKHIAMMAPEHAESFESDLCGVSLALARGESVRGRLLIAADGRESALREMAGIKSVGWGYDQLGLVATIGHEYSHGGRAVQHFFPSGPFAILPLTGNRCSLVWTEEADFAREVMALDDEAFMAHVSTRVGGRLGELELLGGRAGFPLKINIARSFKGDRLALLADAAHAVHPLAGQGLNIGFRDVAAMTEVIVDALRLGLDIGADAQLTRYEQWRRFDSATSALAMDGMNRLFSNDVEPLRAIRNVGLKMVNRSPIMKSFFVREAAGMTGAVPKLLKGERI